MRGRPAGRRVADENARRAARTLRTAYRTTDARTSIRDGWDVARIRLSSWKDPGTADGRAEQPSRQADRR